MKYTPFSLPVRTRWNAVSNDVEKLLLERQYCWWQYEMYQLERRTGIPSNMGATKILSGSLALKNYLRANLMKM